MSEIQHVQEKVCEAERAWVNLAGIQMCRAALKLKEMSEYRFGLAELVCKCKLRSQENAELEL